MRIYVLGAVFSLLAATAIGDEPSPGALPPLPELVSKRGIPPTLEGSMKIDRQNGNLLSQWRQKLTSEQQAYFSAAQGIADQDKPRRFGIIKIPAAGTGYDWQVVARLAGLKDDELSRLAKDKLLIEDVSLRQSFEAYTAPRRPVFITSDSVLNAFHVLFEDSFRELEARRAFKLRRHLERVLTQCREQMDSDRNEFSASELRPGWQLAQLVVGPALRLLDTDRAFFDEAVRDEIDRQVEKIRAAKDVELPKWLEPQSRTLLAIDYRRCKPIGFYTESASLENYFRATRWLQSVPLRADRDNELTAIGLLGYATMSETRSFFSEYETILGRPDDPGLPEAAYEFQNLLRKWNQERTWHERLFATRRWLLRRATDEAVWSKLNDTMRLPPHVADKLGEIQFRVMSAFRFPDSLVLAKTARSGRLPEGLAVAALLGSDFARRHLGDHDASNLESAFKVAREDWQPQPDDERIFKRSLYDEYLDALAALSIPPEKDAPDFMRGEAWATKSCQTILAGWAQMRHTFNLQAKQSADYLGLMKVPPGFVEPNPEFFRRLADLVDKAMERFDSGGVFTLSAEMEAERLRIAADSLEAFGFHLPTAARKDYDKLTPQRRKEYQRIVSADENDSFGAQYGFEKDMPDGEFQAFHRDQIARFRSLANDYHTGVRQPVSNRSADRLRWETLKTVARRLEALAHKQLRQQAWVPQEEGFIRSYGEKMALVMGYFGNSWLTPQDDAPRWATVASDPSTDTMLAVAVGRPRLLHVLYPWQGQEILCTGSVMSYYEYAAKQSLTDKEWLEKLDAKEAPQQPAWLEPYTAK